MVLPLLLGDPPLTPSGDEGRSLLRRELLHPEYTRDNLFWRVVDWLLDKLSGATDAASGASPLVTLLAMVIGVVLAGLLAWLLSRARLRRRAPVVGASVLLDDGLTADQLRTRARTALAEGRHEDAVVDGYRALALRQVERHRIDDVPGATARELALALGAAFGGRAVQVRAAADLFDLVLYGDRPATAEQARSVLALDDDLVGAR
jgi:Domain of unknown function (DUF4129)